MNKAYQRAGLVRATLTLCSLGVVAVCSGADLMDMFADRQAVTNETGQVLGSNNLATVEANEPRHGGKPGGHSVWLTWVAPTNGIMTLNTTNSSFDTLLGVYYLEPGTNPPMQRLKPVAGNDDDDDGTTDTSVVQFGAIAGTNYEIAVDGYEGAVGNIQLNWTFLPLSNAPPVVLNVPNDQALLPGDTLVLSVDFQASSSVKLAWFFNDVELADAESATLVIPNFQQTNVGRYKLRFTAGGIRFFTDAIEVQINSEGVTNTLARDKLLDAPDSGLVGEGGLARGGKLANDTLTPRPLGLGVVRGYSGTQIFDTTFATTDPTEPHHCGLTTGASYWFSYLPPTNGTARLDTDGSAFDTVLAVYTYTPPLVGYQQLVPVVCDNNSGSNGLTSKLQFSAVPTNNYLVVVAGVNGARGLAYLNYSLTAAPPPDTTPPAIMQAPLSRSVAVGSTVSFSVQASGAAPLTYLWLKNSSPMPGQTNASLSLVSVQTADAASYSARVTNSFGSVTSAVAVLSVVVPPAIATQPAALNRFVGSSAAFAVTATGTAPLHYRWNRDGVVFTNVDAAALNVSPVALGDAGLYSVEVRNAAGQVVSVPAGLGVLGASRATLDRTSGVLTVAIPLGGQASFGIDSTPQLNPPVWSPWTGPRLTNNGVVTFSCDPRTNGQQFFRVHF